MYLLFILFFAEVSGFSGNCSSKGDFVFLLDESGSVGLSHFQTMKVFVHDFMAHFSIGPSANQFSVVLFDSNAREAFSLNRYFSLNDIQTAVKNITYSGGGTSIGNALNYSRQFSFTTSHGARTDAAKIVILITDGQSSISNEAELLKDQYITIFCIGVTSGIDEQRLRSVSTHNDYTYITDTFTTLSRIQAHVAEKSCADQIDDCLSRPCQNGGTCEDQLGKYVCHCDGTTTDKDCNIPGLPTVSTGFGGKTNLGNIATINCNVIGIYNGVFWEHQYNGVISIIDTSNSSKYSGGTVSSPSLTIYNFTINDIGSYRCSARNTVGIAHSPTMAFVDIPKSGFNISTVSPVPGQVGHNVTLICNVTATYPPVAFVTWEFDGVRIDTQSIERYHGGSASSPSLFITNLQNTDEGNYTCIVSNLYSSNSVVIFLETIIGLPTVSTGFGGKTNLGNIATINCNVTGIYNSVFWEHQYNGVISIIDTSNSSKYSGGTVSSPSLTIYNFTINDIGSYRCSARNTVGIAHSPTMAFVDIPKSGFNISTVSPVPGQVGHNVTLICNVTATYPPVAFVTWEFDGVRIDTQSIERYHGGSASSPSLFITNLQNTDEGNYTCIVSNLYSLNSVVIFLEIVIDVVAVTTVSPVSGDLGGNVTLICNITSLYSPVASVTWEFNGTRIDLKSDDRYRGGSATTPSLFITNLKTTDQGNYSCSASNMFGSGQAYIYLIITMSSSEDPCDSCGIFYECVSSSDVCSISTLEVALFSLLFACVLLVCVMLLCMIQKYKTRRSYKVNKKDSNANSQQWELGVQNRAFQI